MGARYFTAKPFGSLMTYRSFPRAIEVWKLDAEADGPEVKRLVDVPMDENIPIDGVRTGRRNFEWKSGVVRDSGLDGSA